MPSSIDCGPLSVTNGTLNGTENATRTEYGTVLHVTCNGGYELLGDPVVKCRSDSFWSSVPICLPFGKYLVLNACFCLMDA
jgi:hypothetical protein